MPKTKTKTKALRTVGLYVPWYREDRNAALDPRSFYCDSPAHAGQAVWRVGHHTDERLRLLWLEFSDLRAEYTDTVPADVHPFNHDAVNFGCRPCAERYHRAVIEAGHSRYDGNYRHQPVRPATIAPTPG